VDVRRRLQRLERQRAAWLADRIETDPRWRRSGFRQVCLAEEGRLRAEERACEQVHRAMWQLVALAWELAGQPERATAATQRDEGVHAELTEALDALDAGTRDRLAAACEAALSQVRSTG
jgi:hypothetical protein